MGVPDMKFINRKIPIADVARALDLRFGGNGNIHCWRPQLHKQDDRTASVGIKKVNNTVKCFGCGTGPFGPIDLVIEVQGLTNSGTAARWIAARFTVPELTPGRHIVQAERIIFQFGSESHIGFLVHSGLWAQLSTTARSIVPIFLEFGKPASGQQNLSVQISYRALSRYAGIASPNAISAALNELRDIHWLCRLPSKPEPGVRPIRATASYLVTPRSDELVELAQYRSSLMRTEIDDERELRAEERQKRRSALFTK
jgi:hypothetical protein